MKDRKLMVEVTDEEYELLKKGIKLSDMTTEDIIYELISRSDTRDYIKGPGSVLTGDVDIIGSISIPEEGLFKFQFFKAKKIVRISFPSSINPLAESIEMAKDEIRDKLFGSIDKDIANTDSGGKKPW